MRTTVNLAPVTDAHVRMLMRTRGRTVGQAVNEAIRAGASVAQVQEASYTQPKAMGVPTVPLDGALFLAHQLEDEERIRRDTQRT